MLPSFLTKLLSVSKNSQFLKWDTCMQHVLVSSSTKSQTQTSDKSGKSSSARSLQTPANDKSEKPSSAKSLQMPASDKNEKLSSAVSPASDNNEKLSSAKTLQTPASDKSEKPSRESQRAKSHTPAKKKGSFSLATEKIYSKHNTKKCKLLQLV